MQQTKLFNRQAPEGSRKIFGLADNRINSASSVCIGRILSQPVVEGEERFLNTSRYVIPKFLTDGSGISCLSLLLLPLSLDRRSHRYKLSDEGLRIYA